jgi:acetyl-CoA/propionyl-CoA carboxylase biotin carboxyl carrier protein
VSQYYDNLMAKLIVWGPDRETAIRRARRAVAEFEIAGVPSTLPAHAALLAHPDFVAGKHSTRWLEEEVDPSFLTNLAQPAAPAPVTDADGETVPLEARAVPVEVNGRRFDVKVWLPPAPTAVAVAAGATPGPRRPRSASGGGAAGTGTVSSPMQGTIVKTLVAVGDEVTLGQAVIVLEAMKMENQVAAEKAGKVTELRVAAGDTVGTGDVLVVIE